MRVLHLIAIYRWTGPSTPLINDKQFYLANAGISLVAVVFLFWLIYFHEGAAQHKRRARIVWPSWRHVSISSVVTFLFLHAYS